MPGLRALPCAQQEQSLEADLGCWQSSAYSAEPVIPLRGSPHGTEKIPGQTIQSDDWALPDSSNRSEMWVSFVLADLMDICPAASIQAASAL